MLKMVIKLTMLDHYSVENRRIRSESKKKFFEEDILTTFNLPMPSLQKSKN